MIRPKVVTKSNDMAIWEYELTEPGKYNPLTKETYDCTTTVKIVKFTYLTPRHYTNYHCTVYRKHGDGAIPTKFYKEAKRKSTIERFLQRLNLPPLTFE